MDTRVCTKAISRPHLLTPLSHHVMYCGVSTNLSESHSNKKLSLSERIDELNLWIEKKLIRQSQDIMAFILAKFHNNTNPYRKANEHAMQKMLKKHFCVGFPMPEIASCQSVVSANGECEKTSTRFKCKILIEPIDRWNDEWKGTIFNSKRCTTYSLRTTKQKTFYTDETGLNWRAIPGELSRSKTAK
ncbi:hypothetical protein RF11_15698 [Thelohanellus kitauei]|uniref:Uncharacterized protein n=1 Tax=Thelohanellus kitauei TaxID=669202 RepID=A0A0C2N7J9_THEKT|nr:hypothetical protein RF11_15698 [Thelohanellus kitauei]